MTRRTGWRKWAAGAGFTLAAAVMVGGALAHGGYGPGHGAGCGAGYGTGAGPGCTAGSATNEGCGAGAGPGAGCGAGFGPGAARGPALLTDEERAAHRAKMQTLASYDECKAYMAEFSQQLQAKAKDKGQTVRGPNEAICDRMKAHGRFTQ